MTVNAIFALETAAAYRTRETVVLRVRDHVTLQKRLFHELGRALFAFDWPATETRKQCFSGRVLVHWQAVGLVAWSTAKFQNYKYSKMDIWAAVLQ